MLDSSATRSKLAMATIAIIPARGGSKRVERKNIKDFCGQPIIKYSIDAAIKTGLFDEVIVSTDDSEIARTAVKFGASVPSLRSVKNSRDHSTLADMMLEEIEKLEKRNIFPEYLCLLFATTPTISAQEIASGLKLLQKTNAQSVMSVCEFTEPVGRALKIENGLVKMVNPRNKFTRTQDLETRYFDAGRFYWIKRESFKKNKSFINRGTVPFVVSRLLVQDIDTIEDWKMMEMKFKLLHKKR